MRNLRTSRCNIEPQHATLVTLSTKLNGFFISCTNKTICYDRPTPQRALKRLLQTVKTIFSRTRNGIWLNQKCFYMHTFVDILPSKMFLSVAVSIHSSYFSSSFRPLKCYRRSFIDKSLYNLVFPFTNIFVVLSLEMFAGLGANNHKGYPPTT